MSDDTDFNFDTKKAREEVESMTKALDRLMVAVNKLDKSELSKVQQELDRFTNSGSTAAAQMQRRIGGAIDELNKKLSTTGKVDYGIVKDIRALQQKAVAELQAGAKNMAMVNAEMRINLQTEWKHINATALEEAKKLGNSFTLLSTLTGKNMPRPQSKMTEDDIRVMLGMPDRSEMKTLAAQIKGQMQDALATEKLRASAATKMSLDDTRAMLGMPDRSEMKTLAAQIKGQMQDALATEKLRAKSATKMSLDDTRALLGLPSTGDMKLLKAQLQSDAQEAIRVSYLSTKPKISKVDLDDLKYKEAMGSMREFYSGMEKGVPVVKNTSSAFKKLAIDGSDVHSMARGLASGFNLLWLTWGNLVPLFIGAGLSNGFMQTAKTGMEVAHTMSIIEVLGGNTKDEMVALNAELDRIGKSGPFGPLAVAESMKVLSLAGLKANEILAVTQDVLNFSIAGTTDLKTAADTLVSVSTAFGMGAAGFGRVSDVISKAAAESKTSVESFSNAMKTASVINKQYGVSLEDTATAIAAMSQLGIEGTAAGTALRNMYSDLSGRSTQVAKVLKAQGIEMRTATGEFRPMIDVVADLSAKLSKLDGIGQKNLLQAILSERGAKGMIELLELIQTKAKESGKGFSNALQEMRNSIEQSYGFAAISAAKLAQTTASQFDAVKATLQTSMNDAYKAMEPVLYLIANQLKNTFSSPEFVQGLSTMVTNVVQVAMSLVKLTGFIVDHQVAVAAVAVAYGVAAAAIRNNATALAASTAATAADTAATVANNAAKAGDTAATVANNAAKAGDTAATVANNAAKAGSVGILATMGRLLPGIGTAITIAAGAWMVYDFWQSKSKNTSKEAADLYNNNIAKNLEDEAARLKALNDLRATGLTLTEAQALLDSRAAGAKATAPAFDAVNYAIRNEFSELTKLNKLKSDYQSYSSVDTARKIKEQEARLEVARNQTVAAKRAEQEVNARVAKAQEDIVNERKRDAALLKAEADKRNASLQFGAETFSVAPKGKDYGKYKVAPDNDMAMIEKAMNDRLGTIKKGYDNEKQLSDAYYNAGIITQGQYEAQVLDQTVSFEQKSIEVIKQSNEAYLAAYAERYDEINKKLKEAKAAGDSTAVEQLTAALDNLNRTKETIVSGNLEKVTQIEEAAFTRMRMSVIKADGELIKLAKTSDDYWLKDRQEKNKAIQLQEVADKYRFINESLLSTDAARRASAEAGVNETQKHAAQLDDLNKKLDDAEKYYQDYALAILISGKYQTEEGQKALEDLQARIDKLKELIALNKYNAGAAVTFASQTAYNRAIQAQQDTLTRSVSDAVVTGLTEGGKAGRKKLRDLIVAELKKPITLYIQALISPLMAGAFNMLGIGGGGGGQGDAGGTSYSQMNAIAQSIGKNVGSAFANFATTDLGAQLGLSNHINTAVNNPSAYIAEGAKIPNVISDFGQTMQTGLTMLTNTLAGFSIGSGINNMISGGYSTGKGMDKLQQVGILVGSAIGGPLVGAIVGAVSGIFNRLFGRKLKDTGIEGTFGGDKGFEGRSYQFYEGGLFRSDKTKYSELDKEIAKFMQDSFKKMRTEVAFFANALGIDASKIANFTSKVKISLMGLNQEQAQAAFQEALATANNELAEQVLGTWETTTEKVSRTIYENIGGTGEGQVMISRQIEEEITTSKYKPSEFAKDGEKAIDTLKRLATSLITVNGAFDTLGYKLVEASLKGGDLASKIIDAFGDIDKFISATDSYYKNFYSDAERKAITQRQLDTELGKLGLKLPKTREEYRRLVEAQGLNTEAGRKAFAMLVQLSGSFADIVDAGKTLDDILQDAFDALEAAYKRQIDIAKKNVDAAQKVVDSLKPLVEFLNNTIRELYNTTSSTSKMSAQAGQMFIETAIAEMRRSGKLPDTQGLTDAVQAIRDDFANTVYASQFEEDNARLVLAGKLEAIRGVAEPQLTAAEQALKVAKDILSTLEAELDMYTEQMRIAKEGLDATKDIATAVRDFQAALLAQQNGGKAPGTSGGSSGAKPGFGPGDGGSGNFSAGPGGSGGTSKEIKPGMKTSDGRYYVETFLGPYGSAFYGAEDAQQNRLSSLEDEAKKAWADAAASGNIADLFTSLKAQGITLTEAAALYGFYYEDVLKASEAAGVGRFAKGGFHHGGLRIVGEDGPELEATGSSRVWNARQLSMALSSTADTGSSGEESIAELRNAVMDNRAGNVAIMSELREMRRVFTQWNIDGLPKERVET